MRTIKGNPNNKDWLRYWLNIGQKLLRQKGAIALPPPPPRVRVRAMMVKL